ncbi:MAG: DUF4287 domain-containing protein [Candidatus Saccharibacteria bacterium]
MTFQAYMDNIQAKTGISPDQFIKLAKEKGFFNKQTKAGEIVAWLKADYELGHGHAMSIVKLLKDKGKDEQ